MKNKLLTLLASLIFAFGFSQTEQLWKPFKSVSSTNIKANKKTIANPSLYQVDLDALKTVVSKAQKKTGSSSGKSNVIVSFPNGDGEMQNFSIFKISNFSPELEANHPEITSYAGESTNGRSSKIYFSISPLGLSSMQLKLGKEAVYIEPYDTNNTSYIVYKKSDRAASTSKFDCSTKENSSTKGLSVARALGADDGLLRTYRLALSCTGEYTQYFGGTKALALAGINNTITRVNGVFENDFAIHLTLIPEQESIIFTDAATDPYSVASTGVKGSWNKELMNVLHGTTYGIGDAKFDIGHLFGASGGGGNAGCIGCVCSNDTSTDSYGPIAYKGSGYTSPANKIPSGDNFDIDYVAHEMGHQFGGNHTFTNSSEGTIAQVEPGSGSTIMGYAGITSQDVQAHSDPYFHAVSIQQITGYIKSISGNCSVNTPTGNTTPTANAGADYTIPKSTPFILTGIGSDANGDAITYAWEEMDVQNSATTEPSATKTSGPAFRSNSPSTNPTRTFPNMTSVLANSTTTAGTAINVEVLPSVARTLKFRLTVRDNKSNGAANAFDDMVVTVNSSDPFTVTSQNATGVYYSQGSTQTVTWNVANTNTLAANVEILLSTDSGSTWTSLVSSTPNDGTETITIPSNVKSDNCRIMIKALGNIFFNVNTTKFSIIEPDTTPPTAPTLSASKTTSVSTDLSFTGATDNVVVSGYDIYKDNVLLTSTNSSPYTVTGLTPSTTYLFSVKAKDASGNISVESNSVNVTTLEPDTTPPTAPTLTASGTSNTSVILTWSGATDNVGVKSYDIYKDDILIGSTNSSTYTVTGLVNSTTYIFTVKAKDEAGNISAASNPVTVTTLAAPLATELYISEYYEGISNDKLLEISNPSSSDISLGNYSVKKQTNGAGGWVNELVLSGTIKANSTLVLKNSGTSLSSCTFTSQEVGGAPIDFNGDDPVALFKNGTLIDVVGTFNSTAKFGQNVNLRRNVNIPNKTYTTSEWDSFAITTSLANCENLGILNPSTNLATSNSNLGNSEIIILPNPVKGDTLFVRNAKNNTKFEIFDASGKLIKKGTTNNNSIDIRTIKSGAYIIKIDDAVKRFIKE